MTISEIKKLPTTFRDAERGDCHESILRSFQVMKKVEKMLKRGDSNGVWIQCGSMFPWKKRRFILIGLFGLVISLKYGKLL